MSMIINTLLHVGFQLNSSFAVSTPPVFKDCVGVTMWRVKMRRLKQGRIQKARPWGRGLGGEGGQATAAEMSKASRSEAPKVPSRDAKGVERGFPSPADQRVWGSACRSSIASPRPSLLDPPLAWKSIALRRSELRWFLALYLKQPRTFSRTRNEQ